MGKLNVEQEITNMNKVKEIMRKMELSYADIPKTMVVDPSIRSWFNARKTSLLRGNLEDDEVEFYKNNDFDFGIKLLSWADWCDMLKIVVSKNDTRYIGENYTVDSTYKLGKWVKKQNQIWRELPEERKIILLETGVQIKCLYENYSPYQFGIIHNDKKYENALDFFRSIHLPLEDVFRDVNKWGNAYICVLVKENGGILEQKEYLPQYYSNKVSETDEKGVKNENMTEENDIAVGAPLNNINTQKSLMFYPQVEEESLFQKEDKEKKERKELKTLKNKLEKICALEDVEKFVPLISAQYRSLIVNGVKYPVLKEFSKNNIRKMLIDNRYVRWKEESEPVCDEKGRVRANFFSYMICDFGEGRETVKRISLDILYCGRKETTGGLYCEGEDYIELSNLEIQKYIDTVLTNYAQPFEQYEKRLIYSNIILYIDGIKKTYKISNSSRTDGMIKSLGKSFFEWEIIEDKECLELLPQNVVLCKRIEKDVADLSFPEIFMILSLDKSAFEPELKTEVQIIYKKEIYCFQKKFGKYELYRIVR